MLQPVEHFGLRFLGLAGFFLAWHLFSIQLSDEILPTPVTVIDRLFELIAQEEMLHHLNMTLWRVTAAFLLAMGLGSLLGILMGRADKVDHLLDGLLILMLNLPALVVIFLCYIWLGLTEAAAITAVAINKIPNTAVTLREGARAIDKDLMQVAEVYRISTSDRLLKVFLPQLYPYLVAAARSGLALVWKIVLVVELLGRSDGVGFMLGTYFQYFDIASILAYTIAFATIIYLLDRCLMAPLERRFNNWRNT